MKSKIYTTGKTTLTYVLLTLGTSSFAQTGFTFTATPGFDHHSRDTDTVPLPDLFPACYDNLVTGMVQLGPVYISGTNSHDPEKAQRFEYAGGGNITKVHVAIGIKADHASNTEFVVNLYTVGEYGPEELLGTSQPLTYDEIHTASGVYTTFEFSPSVAVPDSFFVSAVVSTGDPDEDEIVLVTALDGSDVHNLCGQHTAWEKHTDDGWYLMSDNIDSWGIDLVFLMIPEIDNSTAGIHETSPLTALKVYPNPATGMVNFACAFDRVTGASLTIMDMTGRTVYAAFLPGATVNQQVNTGAWSPGIYHYRMSAGTSAHSGKFAVE